MAAQPRIYEWIQVWAGLSATQTILRDRLSFIPQNARIVDIGGGTGLYRSCLPPMCRYSCLDIDEMKLQGFRVKNRQDTAILGNAIHLPLKSQSVDAVMCIAVTHHLEDDLKEALVREAMRVIRDDGFLIFLDAVQDTSRFKSRLLWAYDRGSYPGTEETLLSLLSRHAKCNHWESYSVHHRYALGIFSPLASRENAGHQ